MISTYRRAALTDVAAVVELVESAYRGESSRAGWTTEADLLHGQRTDTAAVEAAVSAADGPLLLAQDSSGRVVGCCQLRAGADGVAQFGMFAVRPGVQGAGVGSALLAEAERVAAAELGAHEVQMTVITQRTELIAYYERRGYSPTGQTRPFPYGDDRFGLPQRPDLSFDVLAKLVR